MRLSIERGYGRGENAAAQWRTGYDLSRPIVTRFSELGLRNTAPRRAIAGWLSAASSTGEDFTADDLWHGLRQAARPSAARRYSVLSIHWNPTGSSIESNSRTDPVVTGYAAAAITTTTSFACYAGRWLRCGQHAFRPRPSTRSRTRPDIPSSATPSSCLAGAGVAGSARRLRAETRRAMYQISPS